MLSEEGFNHVYQLHGGVLKYFDTVPSDESLWNGELAKRLRKGMKGHHRSFILGFHFNMPPQGSRSPRDQLPHQP